MTDRKKAAKERLRRKIERLNSDLPPEHKPRPVKRKPIVAPGDLPRWDYRR